MHYPNRKVAKALWSLVLSLLCMFSAGISWSQATQQFTGRVVDTTGAVIPAAEVVVHNQATGVDVKTVTTGSGDYTVTYPEPTTLQYPRGVSRAKRKRTFCLTSTRPQPSISN